MFQCEVSTPSSLIVASEMSQELPGVALGADPLMVVNESFVLAFGSAVVLT